MLEPARSGLDAIEPLGTVEPDTRPDASKRSGVAGPDSSGGTAYDPLNEYQRVFAARHAALVDQAFAEATKRAGVDVEANQAVVQQVHEMGSELATRGAELRTLRGKRAWLWIAVAAILSGATIVAVEALAGRLLGSVWQPWALTAAAGAVVGAWFVGRAAHRFTPLIRDRRDRECARLRDRGDLIGAGLEQLIGMLTSLPWALTNAAIAGTVPGLRLDPYLSETRMADLVGGFGMAPRHDDAHSMLDVQGGDLYGYPFVAARALEFTMGTKKYTGSLVITWTELKTSRDSNGRTTTRRVRRSQTLRASVVKPFPEYREEGFVVYGNEVAPGLSFGRKPSKLSQAPAASTKGTVRRLEKQARKSDSGFTMMANQDFEALFHADNRDDEVGFRVLFTPAAQQQMVALLRDSRLGYGDDFTFRKEGRAFTLRPTHLAHASVSGVPGPALDTEEGWNLAAARAAYLSRSAERFRRLYFALAPLLAIPVLHEGRPAGYPQPAAGDPVDVWGLEALANSQGEARFADPRSVTRNVLKARSLGTSADGSQQVEITAYGFAGRDRVDFITVRGRDGNRHQVPVPWVEYLPVWRYSYLTVTPRPQDSTGAPDAVPVMTFHA